MEIIKLLDIPWSYVKHAFSPSGTLNNKVSAVALTVFAIACVQQGIAVFIRIVTRKDSPSKLQEGQSTPTPQSTHPKITSQEEEKRALKRTERCSTNSVLHALLPFSPTEEKNDVSEASQATSPVELQVKKKREEKQKKQPIEAKILQIAEYDLNLKKTEEALRAKEAEAKLQQEKLQLALKEKEDEATQLEASKKVEAVQKLQVTSQVPPQAFGKAAWNKYFGVDVGVEPPLPPNITEILNSPCPIWTDKYIGETHLLMLIPETLNGRPLTIDWLDRLASNPKNGGTSIRIDRFSSGKTAMEEHFGRSFSKSHWVLMPRQILPDSTDKTYEDQLAMVKELSIKAEATYPRGSNSYGTYKKDVLAKKESTYEVASVLDVLTCILCECVRTGNILFAGRVPGHDEWTLCGRLQETTQGRRLLIGSVFNLCSKAYDNGPFVGNEDDDGSAIEDFGVVVLRKFDSWLYDEAFFAS